ncbi:MAG: prolyl oligopeptidase family serine peptidase [Bacilli bacterium]|nr:prolyl oligopeptidase family serine peptidase [Bacilli bacterium]
MACDTSEMLTVFYYAKISINILFVLVPILLIVLGSIDFFKVVTSGDSYDLGIATYNFFKRIILSGILMMIPFAVNLLLMIAGFNIYEDCYKAATEENIDALRKKELEEWEKEKAEREKEEEEEEPSRLNVKKGTRKKSYGGMEYFEVIPSNPKENMALVVFLHGDGEYSNFDSTKSLGCFRFVESGSAYVGEQFIFIAPHGGRQDWSSSGIVSKLMGVIDHVVKEYKIDKKRIYITGHSRGAMGVWTVVNRYPSKFAAAVPISGTGSITPSNWRNVPTRAYAGTYSDDSWAYGPSRSNCNSINSAGGNCSFHTVNVGHGGTATKAYTKELFKWMLKQKR